MMNEKMEYFNNIWRQFLPLISFYYLEQNNVFKVLPNNLSFFLGGAKVSRISLLDDAWKNFEKTAIGWNREVKTKGYFL